MAFSVTDFRAQLVGGGARPSQFQVFLTNPIDTSGDGKMPFMCKAAQLPTFTIGKIEAPYFGRKIQLAGDRIFEPWTVTIINDEDFLVRNALERWQNSINSVDNNIRETGSSNPSDYKTQAQVVQYGQAGQVLREYSFEGLFPTEISSVDLNWETTDTIEEFTVTFEYDLWRVSGGITGSSTS